MIEFIPIWPTVIAFGFLVCLILLMLIYTKFHWMAKACVTALSLPIFILAYMSVSDSFGWPSSNELPMDFQIIWADVRMPDTATGDQGAIYYWVKEVKVKDVVIDIAANPRAYQLPYTIEDHKQASQAQQTIAAGEQAFGTRKAKSKGKGKGNGTDAEGGDVADAEDGEPVNSKGYEEDASNGSSFKLLTPNSAPPTKVETN